MAEVFEVFAFGDETGDFAEPLQRLCERQKGVLFLHFLEELKETLRDEVRRQPRHVRDQIPEFTDILDLVQRYRDSGSRNQILETTLTCVYQLASVISYFDDQPSQYLVPSNTLFIGLCTGLLSAATVSSSQSNIDLINNSLKAVKVAFRIGIKVNGIAQRLSRSLDIGASESWSTLVMGAHKEDSIAAVTRFNKEKGLPHANQVYVSAQSRDVVTVSGPPANTKALLLESEYFQQFKTVPLDVFGPFHASHLYSDNDLNEVLQPITETNTKFSPSIRVISGLAGGYSPDMDADQFMLDVVGDILVRPLLFDGVLSAVAEGVIESAKSNCKVFSVGPSRALTSIASALKSGTALDVSIEGQLGMTKLATELPKGSGKIAVVGMAGRFPNSDNLESFWSVLEQGLDLHRRVPADRFDIDAHYDPTGKKKNTSHTPYGCFIEEPGLFDPKFFNMSPREAYQTDPMGRLALVTAHEALEMSGFVPNRTPSSMLHRIGTFYGQTSDDWRQLNAAEKIDTYYIPGTIRAFATGRINYHYKFAGPSYNVDTACSSSFSAIQLACTSLLAKECDTAVAGGVNVMTTPDLFAGLSRAHFLSKTGSCKTFDDGADGFCRGDGVGSVVLKRLEDAEADNDPILGVILGTATNHSSEAVSITQPHGPAQEFLYRKILKSSGLDPLDVSYVEMHGTGTQAGDGTEMRSITNVFAPQNQGRQADQTLHLGALKSNIGHGEASAGVASLIKTLVMLQKSAIPPHVGVKTKMNTTFPTDLHERGVRIAFKETPWVRPVGGKRRAYLNNFGASGGNTGLLLEDAPESITPGNSDPRTAFVVSVTAKSVYSLEQNVQRLVSYLESKPETSLSELGYTTTARRTHLQFRLAYAVSNISELKQALISAQPKAIKPISAQAPRVGFVFTGQGSHYAALGKQLFEHSSQFQSDLLEFNRIGQNQGFPSFLPLVDGTMEIESLSQVVLQLGQSCIQMALARLWKSWGVKPSTVLGHSLGEYAALNAAGVLSASDTIFLVGRRAQLLEEFCTAGSHTMLAVAASVESAQKTLAAKNLEIACINGPKATVISGLTEDMISYSKTFKAAGVKCILLPTAYAFHSAQVEVILNQLKEIANSVTFGKPAIPVVSSLLGTVVTEDGVFGSDYLVRQAREAVNFMGAVETAKSKGLIDQNTIWVEMGPAPVCSAFLKACLGNETLTVPSLRKGEDAWKTTSGGLSLLHCKGVSVDWEEVHREYESSHKVLSLPAYAFENKTYWIDYHNNWCLTKGEVMEAPTRKTRGRHLSTASVQNLTKEDFGAKITVIAESDLADPDLNHAVTGHLVNGSALCPAGVYADIASTMAGYIHKKVNKTEDIGLNVRMLEIVKPLIAKGRNQKESQIMRITATADRPLSIVKIAYNSVLPDGKLGDLHATCSVDFGDVEAWRTEWSRLGYLFKSRIDVLAESGKAGRLQKLDRKGAYEGFSSFVEYDKKYHGMKEVVIDKKNFEATSVLEFQANDEEGDFDTNPVFIDNISHLSGYILNGSGAVDGKTVYISHGLESLRIARPLSSRKSYRNYVKMHPGQKQTMSGDVYVFEGDEVVALIGGVKFQAIPRTVIDKLLPPIKGSNARPAQPQRAAAKTITASKPAKKVEIAKQAELIQTKVSQVFAAPVVQPQIGNSSVVKDFMNMISEELGLDDSELHDGATFVGIGLDSLMSLMVTGRMREELDLEVPTSLFVENPTIGEAKAAIIVLAGGVSSGPIMEEKKATAVVTVIPVEPEPEVVTVDVTPSFSADNLTEKLLSIVSEEIGIELSELLEMNDFAEIGIDSLMSLTITGRVREELEFDIPTSFFTDYPGIREAKMALSAMSTGTSTPDCDSNEVTSSGSSETLASSAIDDNESVIEFDLKAEEKGKFSRSATSILLQGSPKTASKILFLLPDGSGSATSYSLLPNIAPDLCVFGLNCPFMKTPEEFNNGIEGVAALYLAEIKRRQPDGPYCIGGWSAGGVLAYQIAYSLWEKGEKIERLVLIDSPCPINLEPLPTSLLQYVDSLGLLGSQAKAPEWLMPHFEASIRNLTDFIPYPMDPEDAPKTVIIWANNGLIPDGANQEFPRHRGEARSIKFLLDSRRSLGTYGWEKLIGEENITIDTMEGNHFTMIREPEVDELAILLRRSLDL